MDTEKSSKLTLTCTDDATALKHIPLAFNGSIGLANTLIDSLAARFHVQVSSKDVSMFAI
ncbi:hypothetical protein Bca52824_051107 [Brassica carinata]|uniref:Uncharacterized protein n=1 Tax=Brassica carinata TaxID=52824 RepID=A0A8X7UID3_BRACI|nr:hypothetical protein Bca52824_051107 [Brassica carinata]